MNHTKLPMVNHGGETERGAKIAFSRMNSREERISLENSGRLEYIEFDWDD